MSSMVEALVKMFLTSTAVPAVLVGLACGLVGGGKEPWRGRLQAVFLALGYLVGAYVLLGRLSWPPADVSEAFSFAALLLAVFVLIRPKDLSQRYGARAVFVVACGALVLWPLRAGLNDMLHYRNLLAFFCLGLGVWSIVERSAHRVTRVTLVLLPLIAATAVSLLLLFSASASFSQLVTILCGILGALLVLAVLKPERVSEDGVTPFISVFVILFMAFGHFYLDVNPWHMIYLCLPYLLLWIRAWIPVPKHRLVEPLVFGLISALPLGYFLWTVFQKSGPLF
jgi:hypothetical protein